MITVSLWETREDADAAEARAAQVRAGAGHALDLVTADVQVLEVAVQGSAGEPPTPPTPPAPQNWGAGG